jgi:hypothetical protein
LERCKKVKPFEIQAVESCDVCTPTSQFKYPSLLSILILILPKCPFCFVAYTSAMTMCGSSALVSQHLDWAAYLAISLAIIVVFCIARNYRGIGTSRALILAIVGLLFVLSGLFQTENIISYYIGSILLLIAAFYNGGGFKPINKFINHFSLKNIK